MNVGATEQEVLESKKLDLTKRRKPSLSHISYVATMASKQIHTLFLTLARGLPP